MRHRRKLKIGPSAAPVPDINVTPLVDVVLVLLIIFMVVTPLVERELRVATPPMEQVDQPQQVPEAQLMLAVKADGTYSVNDEVIAPDKLTGRLAAMLAAKTDKVVFFNADDEANYEVAVNALDDAKAAGAKTIGMITALPTEAPEAPPGSAPSPAPAGNPANSSAPSVPTPPLPP